MMCNYFSKLLALKKPALLIMRAFLNFKLLTNNKYLAMYASYNSAPTFVVHLLMIQGEHE